MESAASIRKLSDHSPLTIKIWGVHPPTKKQTRFFDATLLSEENGKAQMLQAWSGEMARPSSGRDWATWLEEAIGRVAGCNARLAKEKGRARGTDVRSCAKKIQLAEIQLQRDPENVEIRGLLSEAQGQLAEKFQDLVARNRHISSANWLRYGDTCSKTFFDFHRIGKKKALVRELETDSGTVSGQHDLAHYVTGFYTRLYTSDADSLGTSAAQEQCWQSVPSRVSDDANADLISNISVEEVAKAFRALPKGKAPGHDGIPMEFFHEFEKEVASDLHQAFTAMLDEGETSVFINKGLITLIPKNGDHARLNNWRPITLLESIYKILAKLLAGRLQAILPSIICPNQTGFVEGRSILDNVFIAQESLSWAEESNQDLVLLLLDFEKAFDKIEWGFLFGALEKLGFGSTWIRWIRAMYKGVTSSVRMNGEPGPDFSLARSVRQGCPLAPYLFILATDVLGHMLADPRNEVAGLSLPRGALIRDQTFTDDTALFLQGTPSNLDKA